MGRKTRQVVPCLFEAGCVRRPRWLPSSIQKARHCPGHEAADRLPALAGILVEPRFQFVRQGNRDAPHREGFGLEDPLPLAWGASSSPMLGSL